VWHLPPPIPDALPEDGYGAFRSLLRANTRHAGALRIDHVMGLSRLYWIPEGAPAAEGAYVRYPMDDLLGVLALESVRARCMIIGEDLGTVPEGFRERLAAADVLSFQPLWFQRDGMAFRAPSRYSAKAVACVSTHDLPTIAGWWNGADIAEKHALRLLGDQTEVSAEAERRADKAALAAAVRTAGISSAATFDPLRTHVAAVTRAIHRFVGASPAALMLVQADDLAAETAALNLPGTDRERPNWRRKVGVAAAELWHTDSGVAVQQDFAASRGRADGDGDGAAGPQAGAPVDPRQY
jgi:glycogen operon protein